MKNFLISLLVMLVSYGVGHYFGGTWLAGIPTGFLGLMISYFLLARSSMRKLEGVTQKAMALVQEGQSSQKPEKMLSSLDAGLTVFEKGLDLSKEQFLMAEIVHAQMGALLYQGASLVLQLKMQSEMQRNRIEVTRQETKAKQYFRQARFHLEKAHSKGWVKTLIRNWQGIGMLSVMEFSEGKKSEAIARLVKCKSIAKDDPLFWGAYTWMLYQNDQKSDAMLSVHEGLGHNASNKGLQKMSDAIANQKEIEPIHFGMMWYSFFPEQLTVNIAMKLQSEAPDDGNSPAMNRQQRRAIKKRSSKA